MSEEEKKPSQFLIAVELIFESLILLKSIDWISKNGWDDPEASIAFLGATLAIIYTLFRGGNIIIGWLESLVNFLSEIFVSVARALGALLKTLASFLSGIFAKNLLGLGLFLILVYLLGNFILNIYTQRHRDFELPNFEGLELYVAYKKAKEYRLTLVIEDSIYSLNHPPHYILEQNPEPLARVKPYRNIYLTITKKEPDWIELPAMQKNQAYETYSKKLKDSYGIISKIKERRFDSKLPNNTILNAFFEGKRISPNDIKRRVKIPMGSTLEFTISEQGSNEVQLPQLVCRRFDEAQFLIASLNLKVGNIYGEVSDRNNAYIWKQDPSYESDKKILMGTAVDLYLSSDKPSDCED